MHSRTVCKLLVLLGLGLGLSLSGYTQEQDAASLAASVPRLINYSGAIRESSAKTHAGIVSATFSLYTLPDGGSPLWVESQKVQVDAQGHYTVVLGANSPSGLPLDLFTSGKSLWLGVQPQISGAGEQPRVLLVAVPYALKSADSDTLGGRPASDFVTVESLAPAFATAAAATTASDSAVRQLSASSPIGPAAPCASMTGDGSALAKQVAIYSGACALTEDTTFVDVGGNVGIGLSSPASPLSVRGTFTVTSGLPYGEDFETTYNPSAASTATSVGQFIKTTAAGANSQSFILGQELLAQNIGTGMIGTMQGMQGKAYNTSTGTITSAQGLYFQVRNLGTGTISNGYGIFLDSPTNAAGGTFTNYYGLYLATPTGPTNNFSLYSAGGTNYFGGNVGIGTKTPGQALEISGNLKLDGSGHGITYPDGSVQTSALAGSGTVTSVGSGAGLTGGPITTSGTLRVAVGGVTNAMLVNPSLTVAAGTGLTGGGSVALGGTTTLNNAGILGVGVAPGLTTTGGQTPTLGIDATVVPELAISNFFSVSQFINGYLDVFPNGDSIAYYGFNTSTDSTHPTMYLSNSDSTNAGDLVFQAVGGNYGGNCTIDVSGNLFCTGVLAPVVKTASNKSVALYGGQSTESWVEDYGSGQLVNGVAIVRFDQEYAGIVSHDANYHVFLTPGGDCQGLYMTNRSANSFEVRELRSGASSVQFDYRIVAHRAGFETVRMPDVTEKLKARPNMPKPPQAALKPQ